jgi:hypothetical protein
LPLDKLTEINSYLSSPESGSSENNLLQLWSFLHWPDRCLLVAVLALTMVSPKIYQCLQYGGKVR